MFEKIYPDGKKVTINDNDELSLWNASGQQITSTNAGYLREQHSNDEEIADAFYETVGNE